MKRSYCLTFLCLLFGCGGSSPEIESISVSKNPATSEAAPIEFAETDWPMWRGIGQDGIQPDADIPIEWSATENIVWKQRVPGRAHSSPIVVGDKVFVTSADENQKTQTLFCFSQKTGERLWEKVINEGGFPQKHYKNSFASATPASDGHVVFVAFVNHDRLQVAAVDFDGKLVWDCEAGPFQSEHGYGPSPTLYENLVIVAGDSKGAGFLAGIDRASGDIVWRTKRDAPSFHANYATPIVAEIDGKSQLIQCGYLKTISYDPATGEELWNVDGPSTVAANSVAYSNDKIVVSGGYSEENVLCLKPDGSEIIWEASRNVAYEPSPVIDGDSVLVIDNGVIASFALSNGKLQWRERLDGDVSATPIKVGSRFYLPDENGVVYVFETENGYKELANNELDDSGGMATVAVSGESLFVRTGGMLYRIGQKSGPNNSEVASN